MVLPASVAHVPAGPQSLSRPPPQGSFLTTARRVISCVSCDLARNAAGFSAISFRFCDHYVRSCRQYACKPAVSGEHAACVASPAGERHPRVCILPLQDTLTPAGWETPSAARYFRWDAALDLAGNRGPRANGVARNGQLISVWGAMLASSHPRADFGIVDLRTCMARRPRSPNSRNARTSNKYSASRPISGFGA